MPNTKNDWQKNANCRDLPKSYFFKGGKPPLRVQKTCAECPVLIHCYAHAIKHEGEGYWAGMTAPERAKLRQRIGYKLDTLGGMSLLLATSAGGDNEY